MVPMAMMAELIRRMEKVMENSAVIENRYNLIVRAYCNLTAFTLGQDLAGDLFIDVTSLSKENLIMAFPNLS